MAQEEVVLAWEVLVSEKEEQTVCGGGACCCKEAADVPSERFLFMLFL